MLASIVTLSQFSLISTYIDSAIDVLIFLLQSLLSSKSESLSIEIANFIDNCKNPLTAFIVDNYLTN